MLSILIPTYNWDCSLLVAKLREQCVEAGIKWEIIVADDCSTIPLNGLEEINLLENCKLIQPRKNLGRGGIRNFLANHASYPNLLFIDSDSLPGSSNYISTWLPHLGKIVLGGRAYNPAADENHSLLTAYGTANERNRAVSPAAGHRPFTSPNFIIPADVMHEVRFIDKNNGYGHEDTLFGIELLRHGYSYSRIDNPVVHIDIEDNQTYLKKTQESIVRLYQIFTSRQYAEIEELSPLIKTFLICRRLKLTRLLDSVWLSLHKTIERRLCRPHPSLKLFSLYKLTYIAHIATAR